MKKQLYLLILTLLVGCSAVHAQRVVENPDYEYTKSGLVKITKIELNTDNTKLYLRYSCSPGLWITVDSTLTIRNSTGGEVYPVLDVEGIEFGEKVYMTESRYRDFVVTFGAIDPDIKEIDYVSQRWSSIHGVKLAEHEDAFPSLIHGNWSNITGAEGWTYGFYPSFAIIGHEFWTYNEIKKIRKGYELSLQCGDRTKMLYITRKDTLLAIGESKKLHKLYTRGVEVTTPVEVEELSIDPFQSGEMLLQGFIEGYSPETEITTGLVFVKDVINDKDIQTLIEIQPDGRFSTKLKLAQSGQYFFTIDKTFIHFFATPNDSLTVYLDMDEMMACRWNRDDRYYGSDSYRYMGKTGRLNAELREMAPFTSYDFMRYYNETSKLAFQPFYDQTIAYFEQDSTQLEEQLARRNTLPRTKRLARAGLVANYADGFMSSTRNLERKSVTVGDYKKSYKDCRVLPANYFDLLKRLDVSDPEIALVESFSSLINRYQFAPFFGMYNSSSGVSIEVLLEYISRHAKLSTEEQEVVRRINHVTEMDSTERVQFYMQAGVIYTKYPRLVSECVAPTRFPAMMKEWAEMDSISKTFWADTDNFVQQIALSNKWRYELGNCDVEAGKELTALAKRYVTIPLLRANMDRVFQDKYNNTESTAIPEGIGKELFRKLIAPHRGKYILVDFWSTACGPCIGGIKRSHDMRKRLADEKVVFMFVTSEKDSPLEPYNKIMDEVVGGDKQRLSKDDYNKLAALFNVNAIPRYILMDDQGRVVDDRFRQHDLESKLRELGAIK